MKMPPQIKRVPKREMLPAKTYPANKHQIHPYLFFPSFLEFVIAKLVFSAPLFESFEASFFALDAGLSVLGTDLSDLKAGFLAVVVIVVALDAGLSALGACFLTLGAGFLFL